MTEKSLEQSKLHSLLESVNAAAFAAPTAMGLHKTVLWLAGPCTDVTQACNDPFLLASWFVFFLHSIGWKYLLRRIYQKYGIQLDPKNIFNKMKSVKESYYRQLKNGFKI